MAQTKTTKVKPAPQRREAEPQEPKPKKVKKKSGDRVTKEEIDSMLDEIDEVLEENAEEFVKGYVQKGGE